MRQGSSRPASGAVSIKEATPAPVRSGSVVDNAPAIGTVAVNIRKAPVTGTAMGFVVVRKELERAGNTRRPRIRLRVRGLRELVA
ncbi:hypothetical protein GCM10022243_62450 [Saccharothrix violaceirubra]